MKILRIRRDGYVNKRLKIGGACALLIGSLIYAALLYQRREKVIGPGVKLCPSLIAGWHTASGEDAVTAAAAAAPAALTAAASAVAAAAAPAAAAHQTGNRG